jgi:hypothetical protein
MASLKTSAGTSLNGASCQAAPASLWKRTWSVSA